MTSDAISIISTLFHDIWLLFTSWYIPGTNITPASMMLFASFVGIVIRFVKTFFSSDNGGT